MSNIETIRLFNTQQIRTAWDEKEEKWYFSIVDICAALTDQPDYQKARKYWNKLKQRLVEEGFQLVTICHQLKLVSPKDGKSYATDVADSEQIFRIIQSIPSSKAEPFKQWMAEVASERIDQIIDPELSINQAMSDYKRLGYSDNWINQRLKSIEIRKDLTDEWKKRGLEEGPQFATLTDIIYRAWSDMSAKEISEAREPYTFEGHMQTAQMAEILQGMQDWNLNLKQESRSFLPRTQRISSSQRYSPRKLRISRQMLLRTA